METEMEPEIGTERETAKQMEMSFSLCLWEGDLLGTACCSLGKSLWGYGDMYDKLWMGLPKDILELMVLTKIPASSKCRFRCVSKAWRKLLSSPGAVAPSPSRQLLGKLYWHPEPEYFREHLYTDSRDEDTPGRLKAHDLQVATCGCLVCKDLVIDLSFLPKLSIRPRNRGYEHNVVMQDGLLCIVHAGDVFDVTKADVYIVNPMNRTWQLLPKCGSPVPGLQGWLVRVLVSRPPSCCFHVLVRGSAPAANSDVLGHFALLRYSSETGIWQFFPGRNEERLDVQDMDDITDFALSRGLMWHIEYRTQSFQLYCVQQVGQQLSVFDSPVSFPPGTDTDIAGIVTHNNRLYFVGGLFEMHSPWYFVAIWELELKTEKLKWELVSVAPEAVLGDYRRISPSLVTTCISDVKLIGDFIAISVVVLVSFESSHDVEHLPQQDVYFHLPDKSWHNSRKFFCASEKSASSTKLVFDSTHQAFEPRLDILL